MSKKLSAPTCYSSVWAWFLIALSERSHKRNIEYEWIHLLYGSKTNLHYKTDLQEP